MSERYKEQAADAADLVRRYTVPIFKQRTPSIPEFEASGLLIEIDAEHRFLVTAAHVLDRLEHGVYLLLDGREQDPLSGSLTVTTMPKSGDRSDDPIDLGYVRLTPEESTSLGVENFLPIRWFGVRDAMIEQRGFYFVLGYPGGRQTQDYSTRTAFVNQIYYWAPEAKPVMYKHAKLLRESHVLIRYDPFRIVGPKGIGGSPNFHGMSGAGIWRFSPVESYRPDNLPRLVAVHLGQALGVKELVGSRISLVIESLRREYPHLSDKLPQNPDISVNVWLESS